MRRRQKKIYVNSMDGGSSPSAIAKRSCTSPFEGGLSELYNIISHTIQLRIQTKSDIPDSLPISQVHFFEIGLDCEHRIIRPFSIYVLTNIQNI